MLRIVPHTATRVGRSYEHFPDGFELHPLRWQVTDDIEERLGAWKREYDAIAPDSAPVTQILPVIQILPVTTLHQRSTLPEFLGEITARSISNE